jgi:signal transduction histidine kinase
VIDNLLQNIREHTKSGTQATVKSVLDENTVGIQVHNSGPGIVPEHLKVMFRRFWQAEPTQTRTSGASGLGLAITESIVTAHGGTITVRSNDVEGTTFAIKLPRSVPS